MKRSLADEEPQRQEDGEARKHMQQRCRQRHAQTFGHVGFLSEEVRGEGRLAMARRQGVQRPQREGEHSGAYAAGAELRRKIADDVSLQ